MNISIPDELKDRMDASDPSINWSRLAAQAFEARLDEAEGASLRARASDIQEAASKPGAAALEALLEIVREENPEQVEAVREEFEPFFERAIDREFLSKTVMDGTWEQKVPWPLSPESFIGGVREFVLEYHQRLVEPLLGQLLFEVILLRLKGLRKKAG